MAEFKELVEKYKKRSKDQLIDQVALGLTCAETVTEDIGLLSDNGFLRDTLSAAGSVLPFAVIAVTEEMKVILGKKSQRTMVGDTAYRMAKTGAALTAVFFPFPLETAQITMITTITRTTAVSKTPPESPPEPEPPS